MIGADCESADGKPTIHLVLVADVRCYMCGSTVGSLEQEHGGALLFQRVGEQRSQLIRRLQPIRCPRCGGATFLDAVARIRRREEVPLGAWERPRRGRRPKWLVDAQNQRTG